jgi:hypothetical protein
MNPQHSVSIIAQTSKGEPISEGLIGNDSQWLLINNQYSLLALADDKFDETGQSARLSIEILLDDIQTNLSSGEYEQASNFDKYVLATRCIEESCENINDYLLSLSNGAESAIGKGVALTVMQIINGECSFIQADEYCCLHFHEGQLKNLNHNRNTDKFPQKLLGISDSLAIKASQLSLSVNDLLLICNDELLQYIDEEFLRVTLTRFQDSPQMAMRQITIKAQRSGMSTKPLLIIMLINQLEEKAKSWFKR